MESSLSPLLQNANLNIIDYDFHTIKHLNIINRKSPYYVMSYLVKGEAVYKIYDKEIRQKTGQAILIPSNVAHSHIKETSEDATFLWWHFTFTAFGEIDIVKILNLPLIKNITNHSRLENSFSEFYKLNNTTNTISNLLLTKAKAFEVMALVLENFLDDEKLTHESNVPDIFFSMFYDISTDHNATLTTLSRKYHLHPTYISNKFKEYFSISPINLRRKLQLEQAKSLLLNSNLSVDEISKELGFEYCSTFIRFFSSKEGISPLAFRRNT